MPEYTYESEGTSPDLAFKLTLLSDYRTDCLPHWHNSLEVIHVLHGMLRVVINDRRFAMYADDIIVVNAGEVHSTYCKEPNSVALIQIPSEFLKTCIPDFDSICFAYNTAAMKSGREEEALRSVKS